MLTVCLLRIVKKYKKNYHTNEHYYFYNIYSPDQVDSYVFISIFFVSVLLNASRRKKIFQTNISLGFVFVFTYCAENGLKLIK